MLRRRRRLAASIAAAARKTIGRLVAELARGRKPPRPASGVMIFLFLRLHPCHVNGRSPGLAAPVGRSFDGPAGRHRGDWLDRLAPGRNDADQGAHVLQPVDLARLRYRAGDHPLLPGLGQVAGNPAPGRFAASRAWCMPGRVPWKCRRSRRSALTFPLPAIFLPASPARLLATPGPPCW